MMVISWMQRSCAWFLSLARQAAEAESPFPFFHLFGICNINYTTNLVDFLLIPRAFVCFLSFLLQRLGTPSIPIQNIIRAMHPGEVASVGYLSPSNSPSLRVHYNMPQLNITSSNCSSLNGPFFTPHYQAMPVMGGLILPSSCFGSCAASNEAGDDQLMLAAERRKRRMLSNRESARRSRIRKQKHLGELYSQVIRLRSANRLLLDELNRVVSEQDQIIYENNRLQNEESELQKKLASLPGDCNCEPQVAKLQG